MGAYVLILVLATSDPRGGLAMTTADFSSRTACEAAGQAAKGLSSWVSNTRFICVAKDPT